MVDTQKEKRFVNIFLFRLLGWVFGCDTEEEGGSGSDEKGTGCRSES